MDTDANGYSEKYSSWKLPRLEKRLRDIIRPGRPSQEVRALKDMIMKRNESLGLGSGEQEIEWEQPRQSGRRGYHLPPQAPVQSRSKIPRTPKPTEVKITIPPIETGVITVTVRGMKSLIMHKWDEKSMRQIEEKQAHKSHKGRVARDPQAEYNAARYIDSKGRDCVPAFSFKNAIVAAASFLPDITKVLLKGSVFVQGDQDDLIPIKFPGKKPVFRKDMVRIGAMSKTADVRYRPEYPNWEVELTIEFDKSALSAEQIVNLVNRAGFNCGVGEWRPKHGRFRVVRT